MATIRLVWALTGTFFTNLIKIVRTGIEKSCILYFYFMADTPKL